MAEFTLLFSKIFPLYLIVAAGFVVARRFTIDRDTIASLLIYVVAPVVIFSGAASAPASNTYLLLPVLFFVLGCIIAAAFYKLGGLLWHDGEKNILGFTAGTGNTGYFGLPLILAVLGPTAQSIAIVSVLGFVLFESTFGYYLIAKGEASAKETILKVLKLPLIYAFIFGIIINRVGLHFSPPIQDLMTYFKGAYVVLGMMIIGIGLSAVKRATMDIKFTLVTFLAKFVVFPLVVASLVALDTKVLHLFTNQTHEVMMLLSIVPLASNTVAFATKLKVHPEKTAFTVLLSTLFALLYIPLFVSIFLR